MAPVVESKVWMSLAYSGGTTVVESDNTYDEAGGAGGATGLSSLPQPIMMVEIIMMAEIRAERVPLRIFWSLLGGAVICQYGFGID